MSIQSTLSHVSEKINPSRVFAMQTTRKVSSPNIVDELREYMDLHTQFKHDFEESFCAARDSGIREFDDYSIKTLDDFLAWYEYLLGWVPSEQEDGQFIFHVLCFFYYVMNLDPLQSHCSPIDPSTHAPYTWLSDWVIRYAKEVGKFMDSPDSITPYTLATFRNSAPYKMEQYHEPEGGWKTFNEFFARQIDPALRPIDGLDDSTVIVSPADSAFDGSWPIDDGSQVIFSKGIPWPISELLDDANSPNKFGQQFAGGKFCHAFLGPNDYHRQHAPVSGTVLEARVIEGLCYLQVDVVTDNKGKLTIAPRRTIKGPRVAQPFPTSDLDAPDEPGYQFIQARALILIKADNPDIGLVAVLPIGMAQVSSVVVTIEEGSHVDKGQEISHFQFGGSDIVMVFEERANVEFTAEVGVHYNYGKQVAVAHLKA